MKIVFISNYFNHHQQALSETLYRLTEGNYRFLETAPMCQARRQMGYGCDSVPAYVKSAYLSEAEKRDGCRMVDEADVVIAGSVSECYLRNRIRAGKLIFRYAERPLKQGTEPLKYLPRLIRWNLRNPAGKPIYLLAASAFAAADYAKFGLFRDKGYQWGYFPEFRQYSQLPSKEDTTILWVGRFLEWKHPDDVVRAAAALRGAGYTFQLNFIGIGEMEATLRRLISDFRLQDHVAVLGAMRPEQVRDHMERASILVFSSDRQEGWGAVVNEAMNSGCAVVASHAAGAVPYLIKDGENGLIYRSGDVDMLIRKVKYLLDNPDIRIQMGQAAYRTIADTWNAQLAAQRLVSLAEHLLSGESRPVLYSEGPCSPAGFVKDGWFSGGKL